jgi:phospholipase C
MDASFLLLRRIDASPKPDIAFQFGLALLALCSQSLARLSSMNESVSTPASKLRRRLGRVACRRPAFQLVDLVRAPLPWLVIGGLLTMAAGVSLAETGAQKPLRGIHKIQHVIIVMQENRSFDSYFGTYPGADGILMKAGVPVTCLPALHPGQCVRPYHDLEDLNIGGPHFAANFRADLNRGRMNGFLQQQQIVGSCSLPVPQCAAPPPVDAADAVGYHTGTDIPNYWAYAHAYVLQDHMFEPVNSWSFPSHLYLVSGWSATCPHIRKPMSCVSSADQPALRSAQAPSPFAWTDLTFLLHKAGVSWAYYLDHGAGQTLPGLGPGVPSIWNVLPGFTDLGMDHQKSNVRNLTAYFDAAARGALPQVSWISPDLNDSEHPPALVTTGQSYVTRIVNAAMRSPAWNSTAIFLAWDDWGGFYDHVAPPKLTGHRYGFRVPALVISPYAKAGYVDHQRLSFSAYLKFIEDDFLRRRRLNPRKDGRPDARPLVVENQAGIGNLKSDFNFNQAPRAPLLLPEHPQTDLIPPPKYAGSTRSTGGPQAGRFSVLASALVPETS